MTYFCCNDRRRDVLRRAVEEGTSSLNGIDYLEVVDREAEGPAERQRLLKLHMLNSNHLANLEPGNVVIAGGTRITGIEVTSLTLEGTVLTIEVNQRGDFSTYELQLVSSSDNHDLPPEGIDPRLSRINFSFKVECPSDLDCAPQQVCPPSKLREPKLNYLAKDYSSFRQLVFDRMATIIPDWRDRNAADLGTVLVEILAYVGDYLSYEQDSIMTEAYLGTARHRISLRRHARLLNYSVNEGNNARTWVCLEAEADALPPESESPAAVIPEGTLLLTQTSSQKSKIGSTSDLIREAAYVFSTMIGLRALYADHNKMPFYTWSDRSCCLPAGATSATLSGHYPNLEAGDYLVFEELRGPETGAEADANEGNRHVVRLTEVQAFDSTGNPLTDPLVQADGTRQITEITWAEEDKLPFPLSLSTEIATEKGETLYYEDVSVARGNVVPADHGVSIENETLPECPESSPSGSYAPETSGDPCERKDPAEVPVRYRPRLQYGPLTFDAPFDRDAPASEFQAWDGESAQPHLDLTDSDGKPWTVQQDLIGSRFHDRHFVAEIDGSELAVLRFGDGQAGLRPQPGTGFAASYRVGNGTRGNIGAEALAHIVIDSDQVSIGNVRNPLPGRCGRDPESNEDIRQRAPVQFRYQERAVTPEDYAARAEMHPDVQKAAATVRWTGSWHTIYVTPDRTGGYEVDEEFKERLLAYLEPYRCAGFDLEIDTPLFVPLEITMSVCVSPDYLRSEVKRALMDKFSAGVQADGSPGLFHPDRFTFGQPVYVSPLLTEAQNTPGVISAQITTFQRFGEPDSEPLLNGVLVLDRLEIARLDNDPSFLDRGIFQINLLGGQ